MTGRADSDEQVGALRAIEKDAANAGRYRAERNALNARIEAAIRRDCDFVLVFIDEHALASDWVRRETALALRRHGIKDHALDALLRLAESAPR